MSTTHTTTATRRIYEQIKKDMNLPDEAMKVLDITPEYIQDAYNQCLEKGLTHKQAERTLLNLWLNTH